MFRIDTSDNTNTLTISSTPGPNPDGFFRPKNLGLGQQGTTVSVDWANTVQEELMTFLSKASISPIKGSYDQVYKSVLEIGRNLPGQNDIEGLAFSWGSNTTLVVPTGFVWSDDGTTLMKLASQKTIDTANVGVVNGIQAALASNKGYYLYIIYNPTTQAVETFLSANGPSTVTLPTGYTKKRCIGYVATDTSSAVLIPFDLDNAGRDRITRFRNAVRLVNGVDQTSTSFQAVSFPQAPTGLSNYFIEVFGVLNQVSTPTGGSGSPGLFVRTTGDTSGMSLWVCEILTDTSISRQGDACGREWLKLNSSGQMDYQIAGEAQTTRLWLEVKAVKIRV